MKDVKITCNSWDGVEYNHFLSSCRTSVKDGKLEFLNIRKECDIEPFGEGYAYEYNEMENGERLPESGWVVYHRTRADLF